MRGPIARRRHLVELSLGAAARLVEPVALSVDRALMRRNRNLRLVPGYRHRDGGKVAYGEWCWLIGLLQTRVHDLLVDVAHPRVVDMGCGSGLAMIAAEPMVAGGGELIGLDVRADAVARCRRLYPDPPFRFEHLPVANEVYSPGAIGPLRWPVDDQSVDLVTAISVFTHLGRDDARASMGEIGRVLAPGGRVLLSVFLVDPANPGPAVGLERSRFHRSAPTHWRFDRALGDGWYGPRWAVPPERAIGLTVEALDRLAAEAGLVVERVSGGTWREQPGLYFQDLVELRRDADHRPARVSR